MFCASRWPSRKSCATVSRSRELVKERHAEVDHRLKELGAKIVSQADSDRLRLQIRCPLQAANLKKLVDYLEDIEGVEILSLGHGLELIKDLGDANTVGDQYKLKGFKGTHALGHTRMATESDVDIRSAHPYWAYPFSDVSVVHNGQLTNYWNDRRELERHRPPLHVELRQRADRRLSRRPDGPGRQARGRDAPLDRRARRRVHVSRRHADSLGMAKDTMAAKPMVLYEGKDFIALASEEVAIRSIFPNEIDTFDPYEGEVRVWRN